jgi:hypothetical protein
MTVGPGKSVDRGGDHAVPNISNPPIRRACCCRRSGWRSYLRSRATGRGKLRDLAF